MWLGVTAARQVAGDSACRQFLKGKQSFPVIRNHGAMLSGPSSRQQGAYWSGEYEAVSIPTSRLEKPMSRFELPRKVYHVDISLIIHVDPDTLRATCPAAECELV